MAALIPIILGFVGLAVDVGNLYLAHSRLQSAVDAGALAGSLELPYDKDVSQGRVEAAAEAMLTRNFAEARLISVTPGTEVRSVVVAAEADVPVMLLGWLGVSDSLVRATATAGFNHIELAFVIDNSGSMRGTPILQVREACIDLVDLIIPEGSDPDTKIGLVPFRGKVHVRAGVDGLPAGGRNADGSLNQGIHEDFMDDYWALPYYKRKRISLDTTSTIPQIQALTNEKDVLTTAIESQDARGAASGTVISEGLKWGRHVLTPEAPYTEGEDKEEIRKIIILLTDGDTEDGTCGGPYRYSYSPNNYWTNAYYGMADTETHCENGGGLNAALLEQAELAKAEDIEIFAIRYGNSDSVDVQLMKQVASSKQGTDDHYFDTPSAYDIGDVFKQIGQQLGWRLLN